MLRWLVGLLLLSGPLYGQLPRCADSDSAAAHAVRSALTDWVDAANRSDAARMRSIWAERVVGYFPRAAVFGDSAAFATANLTYDRTRQPRVTYELVVDDVVANGSVVVVHDLWTEIRTFSESNKVQRQIRGSELWRCQPDGRWRITRYVSAPEPWVPRR
jgi:ketosteroid isomerase-like protein